MEKQAGSRKFFKKLKNRYRLLIINETNFQEKQSISLTPFNVLLLVSSGILLFSLFFWGVFTAFPIFRDYTPGYASDFDGKMKNRVLGKIEKIEGELTNSRKREIALRQIMQGEDVTVYDMPYRENKSRKVELKINETKADGSRVPDAQVRIDKLRKEEAGNARTNYQNMSYPEGRDILSSDALFFTPLRGRISQGFDLRTHSAIDIVPGIDESVKSTMDGTIIFSGWTPDNGYCISIQHADNWVSGYKHNSVVYKKQGDVVKAGETIAIAGSSGEQSTGVHLHFELWHNGNSVNPLNFIPF